jgi:peptidoglycan DL-endopeptidase CwlO
MTRRGVGAARLSALLTAAIVSGYPSVASAQPSVAAATAPTVAPDGGERPVPEGALQLPYGVPQAATSTDELAKLAAQLNAIQSEVMLLGEDLRELQEAVGTAASEVVYTQYAQAEAQQRLDLAKKAMADAATQAYAQSGGIPDFGLSGLSPRNDDPVHNSAGAAHELALAKIAYESATQAYEQAKAVYADTQRRFGATEVSYKQRDAALQELKKRNADKTAEILSQEEEREQKLGEQYLNTDALAGMKANPKALAAVQWALRQLGKSYLWGAEGPNHFDCSGLVWASYRSTGRTLPRVSRDQYEATLSTSVSRYALLPGDLLFFSSDPYNAATIHHVGIYLGNGRMVHSPTTGDVVKISTVWWSHFYAATRVYEAIQVSTPTPTPSSTHSPSPSPSPSRSTSPSPSASTSASATPAASSSPSGSSSPSPSVGTGPAPIPRSSTTPDSSATPNGTTGGTTSPTSGGDSPAPLRAPASPILSTEPVPMPTP